MIAGEVAPPPVARTIGFAMTSIGDGRAVFEMDTDPARHANPMGTVHGGILCDIADGAMGMAFASTLADGESFTTLELKINYLRPVWRARLRAEGTVLKRGRDIALVACDVLDEKGTLVAHATCTCMVLRGERAAGR
jgi:uncharacterized protein (TIGR00369 family)